MIFVPYAYERTGIANFGGYMPGNGCQMFASLPTWLLLNSMSVCVSIDRVIRRILDSNSGSRCPSGAAYNTLAVVRLHCTDAAC